MIKVNVKPILEVAYMIQSTLDSYVGPDVIRLELEEALAHLIEAKRILGWDEE